METKKRTAAKAAVSLKTGSGFYAKGFGNVQIRAQQKPSATPRTADSRRARKAANSNSRAFACGASMASTLRHGPRRKNRSNELFVITTPAHVRLMPFRNSARIFLP